MSSVKRVGIVAKSNLRQATPHLADIEAWLAGRGLEPVFETTTAALMPANALDWFKPVADVPQERLRA